MALLTEPDLFDQAQRAEAARVITAGTKLNRAECKALSEFCEKRATTPGKLIRDLILRELESGSRTEHPSAELTEIVGLRLLLTTLLKPLAVGQQMTEETFDAVVTQVKRAKVQMATELLPSQGGTK